MSIPFSTKINERAIPTAIVAESHIVGIIATQTYTPGQIRLVEVPQGPAPAVSIPGYTEIVSGVPTGTQFVVDYTTGVITFDIAQDGNTVSASYVGLGSEIAAEDIDEIQNPLSTVATQTITYNWPLAPTVSWSLAAHIVKPASISNTGTDDFAFPHNVSIVNILTTAGAISSSSITLQNQSPLVLQDTEFVPKAVSIEAPTTLTNSYTLKMPVDQGAASTYLENDGSGNLSWVGASGHFVSSITGTANQVNASASTGAVTLSLPQSIATSSTPTFASLILTNTAPSTDALTINNITPSRGLAVNGKIIGIRDNGASLAVKGLQDPSEGSAQVNSYSGIFYDNGYNTTGTLKTRFITGGNLEMDVELQSPHQLRLIAGDNSTIDANVYMVSNTIVGIHARAEQEAVDAHFLIVDRVDTSTRGLFNISEMVLSTNSGSLYLNKGITDGAIVFPSLTPTQYNALTPVVGMIVYDSVNNQFVGRNNSAWVILG